MGAGEVWITGSGPVMTVKVASGPRKAANIGVISERYEDPAMTQLPGFGPIKPGIAR